MGENYKANQQRKYDLEAQSTQAKNLLTKIDGEREAGNDKNLAAQKKAMLEGVKMMGANNVYSLLARRTTYGGAGGATRTVATGTPFPDAGGGKGIQSPITLRKSLFG